MARCARLRSCVQSSGSSVSCGSSTLMVPPSLAGVTIAWRHCHQVRRPGIDNPAPILLRVNDIAPAPWRNGGGLTRELLAWPDRSDWIVRISVAEILASGPFSEFPGVDRWFAVLHGGA